MNKLLVFVLVLISIGLQAQNVGINNTNPQSTLDINGSLRFRPLELNVAGLNSITVTEKTSHLWAYGTPTGDVAITYTFQQEGDIMYISNFTSYHLVMPGAYSVGPGISSIMYIDGEWRPVNENNSGWNQTGNSGTNPAQNFIGTTDNQPLVVKTNNTTRMEVKNNGIVGINGSGDLTGIEMGHAVSGKQTDAGKIQYGGFGGDEHVVNIVGGGTNPSGSDRKVKIWAEGGTEITGEIKPNGTAGQANQVLTSNGDGTMQWAAMSSGGDGGAGAGPWSNWCTDNINEHQPVSDESGAFGDNFGISVSISGDYAIVGAYGDSEGSGLSANGSATIFKRNTSTNVWESQGKLINPGAASEDWFGYSVSISGDYAIVGAYGDDEGGFTNNGSATVFKRNTSTGAWEQQGPKLTNPGAASEDYFGSSVSISGDYAIVGAYGDDEGGLTDNGSATIFKRNTSTNVWESQGKLTNSVAANGDEFGYSVSISGDYAIVGAYWDDEGGLTDNGSATIFKRNTSTNVWESQGKLTNSGAANGDEFGNSVSIFGDYAIVGAVSDDGGGLTKNGSATIFKRNTSTNVWESQGKLTNSVAANGDEFGYSVSISVDYAIVGAVGDDEGSLLNNNGSVTIYRRYGNKWRVVQKFTHPGSAYGDGFGNGVSIDGTTRRFLVGAPVVQTSTGLAFFGKVK